MKMMKAQMDRDDRVQKLFTATNTFYDIVSGLEKEPDKMVLGSLRDFLQRIAQQTTEGCYFIRGYAKPECFGKLHLVRLFYNNMSSWSVGRTGRHLFSKADDKINKYCAVFVGFKDEFCGRVTGTQIVVTRILDDVQDLGM